MNGANLTPTKIPGIAIRTDEPFLGAQITPPFQEWFSSRVEVACRELTEAGYAYGAYTQLELGRGISRALRMVYPGQKEALCMDPLSGWICGFPAEDMGSRLNVHEPLAQLVIVSEATSLMTKVIVLIPSLEEVAAGWELEAE